MATIVETGIRWDKVKEAIERAVWEADRDNPGNERRSVFLGSVFSLTPSGKYYLPFACSNVTPCPQCAGRGSRDLYKRRVVKRREARNRHMRKVCDRLRALGWSYERLCAKFGRKRLLIVSSVTCEACAGCGSREAHLDELYNEKLAAEAAEHDLCIFNGEGDPCDVFAGESRDAEEGEGEGERAE